MSAAPPDPPPDAASDPVPAPASAPAERSPKRARPEGWVDYSAGMRVHGNPVLRALLVAGGAAACALGVLGYLLPGLPGTVFFLIAAWCFAMSSPRLYNRLMNDRRIGPLLRDFRAGRGIPLWVKFYAPAMIVLFAGSSAAWLAFGRDRVWLGLVVAALGAYGIAYILRQPTAGPRTGAGPSSGPR